MDKREADQLSSARRDVSHFRQCNTLQLADRTLGQARAQAIRPRPSSRRFARFSCSSHSTRSSLDSSINLTAMSQQKRRRDATSSGTIRDWLPLVWTAWEDQEEGQDETEPLTDGDGERQAAHEDAAGDADSASMVVSEVSLAAPTPFVQCRIDGIPHALTSESSLS